MQCVETTLIDFGDADDQGNFTSRKIWVKICGKHIYNYPSEKAVSRAGWLHFCILAKDSNLYDAIYLCRRWEEFWELNILSIFGYFPSGKWSMWKGDLFRQNLLKIVSFVTHVSRVLLIAGRVSYRITNLEMQEKCRAISRLDLASSNSDAPTTLLNTAISYAPTSIVKTQQVVGSFNACPCRPASSLYSYVTRKQANQSTSHLHKVSPSHFAPCVVNVEALLYHERMFFESC